MGQVEKQPRNMVPVNDAATEIVRQIDILSGRAFREGKMELATALQTSHAALKPAVAKLSAPPAVDHRQQSLPAIPPASVPASAPASEQKRSTRPGK